MTNSNYIKQYQQLLFGVKMVDLLDVTYFGQPATNIIAYDILNDRLNFLLGWVCRGVISIEKAKAIRELYYECGRQGESYEGIGCDDYEIKYSFTEDEFQDLKKKFTRIYENYEIPYVNREPNPYIQ